MPRRQTKNERLRLWVTYAVIGLMIAAFLAGYGLLYDLIMRVYGSSIHEPARWEAARRLPLWGKLALYAMFLVLSAWYESFPRASDSAAKWAVWALTLMTAVLSFILLQTGDPARDLLTVLVLIVIWRATAALARRLRRRAAART